MTLKKKGRPKKDKSTQEFVFVGIKMPKDLAINLSKDAALNYRARAQHILWILTNYIVKSKFNKPTNNNKPLYTEQEIKDMEQWYRNEQGE